MTREQTVMVVEDDPLIRMSAVDFVKFAGFQVVEASNADEAVNILETRQEIRLVFTDVDMPGTMDGLKLAHYIRDRWPPVMLIVASGKAILNESQLPSGVEFFAKPYHGHAIADAMARMLGAN